MKINKKKIYIAITIFTVGVSLVFAYKNIKSTSAAQSDALNFYCKADQENVIKIVQAWQEAVVNYTFDIGGSGIIIDPGGGGGPPENPYISVSKTATPAGPFQNSQLPLSVRYAVTINAKQGNLTNIQIQYECKAAKSSGSFSCPPNPSIPTPPATISIGSPFTFNYKQTYSTQYKDSYVMDTIRVTATIPGPGNPTASTSASIIIGKPPTNCFVLDSSWAKVPSYKANMESAIDYLILNMPVYATKICAGGNVDLRYNPNTPNTYWGFYHGSYVDIFNLGVQSEYRAKYTLIHEACHVLMGRTSYYQDYLDYPNIKTETPRCFYSYNSTYYEERLCEAITFNTLPCSRGVNFKTSYPIHRDFVETYIYR